jgi:hypothetical protein|tara:strand:- start:283 stop:438 length:156 start_codon:yes stop_codon:yes gene_type:complete
LRSKTRIIGLVIIIIGINNALENDATDFVSGILIGVGIGSILKGKLRKTIK